MRCALPKPINAQVFPGFICDNYIDGKIVAVESYPGSIPTFTWIAHSGHIYTYLPPHAFSNRNVRDCVDFECPDTNISVCRLKIEGGGHAKINCNILKWKVYVASIDWIDANYLAHIVLDENNHVRIIKNSKFQIGGEQLNLPEWKKFRSEWTLHSI